MRITEGEKANNRAAIVAKAGALFRERGIKNVGIADVMREAGFTHGGFYNHFASKEALTAEVCSSGVATGNAAFAAMLAAPDADDQWRAYLEGYLSPAHRDDPSAGCTISALMGDAAHEPRDVQAGLATGADEWLDLLARYISRRYRLAAPAARRRAIETWTQALGAVSLSRALVRADRKLADEVLTAAREKLTR